MSTIWDHTQDISGSEFHRLTSLFPPPDFVKEASHERLFGGSDGIPGHLYGDTANRRFPCHTAPATWMSALFLFDKQAALKPDEFELYRNQLQRQADYFGIGQAVKTLQEKVAAIADNAEAQLPDSDFALVWATAEGTKQRRWPLRNAQEVKVAAEKFAEFIDDFTFEDRYTVANKLLDAAMRYGASLGTADGTVEKSAGRGSCAAAHVAEAFENRGRMARATHPELAEEAIKMAELVRSSPAHLSRSHENLVKLAGLLDGFDRKTGLVTLYDEGGLLRPEEIFFQVTEKNAAEFIATHVPTTTGRIYELESLEKISASHFREWLGDEFADAVCAAGILPDKEKLAAVLPTLDRGMASTFDRMADALAIAPIAQEKAAAQGPLSGSRLFEQAAKYQPAG